MYLILVDDARLVTSDARGLTLYALDGGEATRVRDVAEPSQVPFFTGSPAGERLAHAGGIVARSVTPVDATAHWASAASCVGVYDATDARRVAWLEPGLRLDHESLALSPDGRRVASVVRGGGAVVLDAATGATLWQLDGEIGSGTSWSPDGRWLALGETGQAGGELTIVDTRPTGGGGAPVKHVLPAPRSNCGLFDSPYQSAFASDGGTVVFTSASWGSAGVTAYDPVARVERWSVAMPTTDDGESEHWSAPELAFALGDGLVLVGQDGLVQAFDARDGRERSRLEMDRADARYFAADSRRRGVWVARAGVPTLVPFPDDWR